MRKENVNFFKEYEISMDFFSEPMQPLERTLHQALFPKMVLDYFIASLGLLLTFPILLLAILAIKLTSKGPAFYLQERVGQFGQYFNVIKLRTMVVHAEENGPQWASKDDPRVTQVGKWLRKTRIDELPQFINVLKGEMSIVGPRPERPVFTAQFNQQNSFVRRLTVKPGITGLAQVNGGYDLTPTEKLHYDLDYIQHYSLSLDVKIMWRTIQIILNGDGAR